MWAKARELSWAPPKPTLLSRQRQQIRPATARLGVETSAFDIDPEAMEMMRLELAEAAKATSPGTGTVQ